MSSQYTRDNCKIAVAKILQTIGWHSINSTPLEVLTDIMARYVQQISKITNNYANEFGQTDANLDHLGLTFQEMGINLSDLEEYVKYVNFGPGPTPIPKYPIAKENNLNFLKPGSKEVVTRPVHIHEHLPPMYPLLEGTENDTEPVVVKQEVVEEINPDGSQQFKKPADIAPEFKRPRREEEGSRPTREISSVMMTTSGFLSPAREGKLPEAKAPAPPPVIEPVPALVTIPPDPNRKKPEKRKEKLSKELFKPIPEEKMVKKATTMKDVVKMKQMKAAAAAAAAVAVVPPNAVPHHNINLSNEVRISPIPPGKVAQQKQNFSRDLAAAKAKTEKFNTTITPIPMKPRSPHPPVPIPIDKLFSEPDKKKVNIFKKITNVKDKFESKGKKDSRASTPNLIIDEPLPADIVNKITLSKDITIEPIRPVVQARSPEKVESYFDDGSPPGTPSTPRTPEMIMQSPPVQKEKRKRKEGAPKRKRVKKTPAFLDSDIVEISMERPKTPEAHMIPHMRQHPPHHMPIPAMPPFPLMVPPFGPGLIPSHLSTPMFPFSHIPNFGKTPYFPAVMPNIPPPIETVPMTSPKIKPEPVEQKPVEIIPQPVVPPKPVIVEDLSTNKTPTVSPEAKDKKPKEHKKEKRDKIKKKNKKDKVKEKAEKKKLKELKKDNKEKIKKEKKEKKKEKEAREGESPIPKILLKVNSPSPRPETPETSRKLNIKPIVKKEEDYIAEEKKRETSPVGLAKISALFTGPPKPKNPSSPVVEKPVAVEAPPVPVAPRTPGRPRLKPKQTPKPKKVEQTFKKTDEHGNEVWICPTCGQQDDGRPMIGCDECDAWYHWVCVGIQVPPDENEDWYCKPCLCKKNEDLQSDKKKRRKKKEKKEH